MESKRLIGKISSKKFSRRVFSYEGNAYFSFIINYINQLKQRPMKNLILFLASVTGILVGGIVSISGNPVGDYLVVIFSLVLVIMNINFEHDCSDHKKVVSREFRIEPDVDFILETGKELECQKCGKRWSE